MGCVVVSDKGFHMFKQNVGGIDRAVRIVIGLALLAGFFLNADGSMRWLYLLGIVPLATGLMGSCGLYSMVGFNTCAAKKT